MNNKIAIIVVILVPESSEASHSQIEKEIFEYLAEYPPKLPWCKEVEKVTVLDARCK
jgi:hypothetical protein